MAFFNDQDEQDDELSQGGGVQTSAPLATIDGQGLAPQGTGTAKASAPDKSSNFVGIKQYLDANKNQAAKLGDQAAGVINTSANDARQKVGALNSAADSQIQSTASLDDDVSQKLSTAAETLAPEQRDQIKKTASAQYKGPKNEFELGDAYTNAQKATGTAVQNIDSSGTEQGRMGLLRQINSKPRTQGMDVFDNTLLQAGGGREKLSQAAQSNQDVKGALDQSAEAIRGKIGRVDDPSTPDVDESAGAMGQTAKAQADAYKKIQDAMGAWKSGFTPKVDQARQSLIDQQNRVQTDFGDDMYSLDQENLDLLGLADGQYGYNIDFNNYLSKVSPDQINASNVANEQDYARYGALADLAGENELILDPQNMSQAGTAPRLSADRDRLAKDLAAAELASKARFNVQNTFGDQNHLYEKFGNTPGIANDYAGLQNFIDSMRSNYGEWAGDADAGGGGTTGQSLRNLTNFLSDLEKNRRAVKKNV